MPEGAVIPATPPVGLGTKLGVVVGALASVAAALAPVLDGDQTPESLGALGLAALAFYGVIRGRSDQAAAIVAAKGAVVAAEQQRTPGYAFSYSTDHAAPPRARTFRVGTVDTDDGGEVDDGEPEPLEPEESIDLTGATAAPILGGRVEYRSPAERDDAALEDAARDELAEAWEHAYPIATAAVPPDTGDAAVAEAHGPDHAGPAGGF